MEQKYLNELKKLSKETLVSMIDKLEMMDDILFKYDPLTEGVAEEEDIEEYEKLNGELTALRPVVKCDE